MLGGNKNNLRNRKSGQCYVVQASNVISVSVVTLDTQQPT